MAPAVIIGADECGCGSWAGPLVVAAVAYREDDACPVVTVRNRPRPVADSKTIRDVDTLNYLAEVVHQTCMVHELHVFSAREVDTWGVNVAKHRGLRAVVQRLLERLALQYHAPECRIVVDGETDLQPCTFTYEPVAHADATVWQVSAASILAKAHQIEMMQALHQQDPRYGWNKNMGYGTKDHRAALIVHGVSVYHRKSFAPIQRFLPPVEGLED